MPPTTVTNQGPPRAEFSVRLTKPFDGPPEHIIDVYGEGANKPATCRVMRYEGGKEHAHSEKTGDVPADDVRELSELMSTLRGFPSHPSKDIYGAGAKIEYNTMELQWSNKAEDPSADGVNEIAGEQKDDFKRVAESIEALSRQFAKRDAAV